MVGATVAAVIAQQKANAQDLEDIGTCKTANLRVAVCRTVREEKEMVLSIPQNARNSRAELRTIITCLLYMLEVETIILPIIGPPW